MGCLHESASARVDRADRHGDRGVRVVTVELGGDVERHELARAQDPVAGDRVDDLVLDADADRAGIAVREDRARLRTLGGERRRGELIELTRGDAGRDGLPQRP